VFQGETGRFGLKQLGERFGCHVDVTSRCCLGAVFALCVFLKQRMMRPRYRPIDERFPVLVSASGTPAEYQDGAGRGNENRRLSGYLYFADEIAQIRGANPRIRHQALTEATR
jgi:hypothetical protein